MHPTSFFAQMLNAETRLAPGRAFKVFTRRDLGDIRQLAHLPAATLQEMRVVSAVLPFRVNTYVIDELIDWQQAPSDPMFRLTFPQRDMLSPTHYEEMAAALQSGDKLRVRTTAARIRGALNPHPAEQLGLNTPLDGAGKPLQGLQHKYRETLLFFPSQGQTCHSYCTFCFRWAQFVGDRKLRIGTNESAILHGYLRDHPDITDLLVTGGDPLVMKTQRLVDYLEPLLKPEFAHLKTIRIGTKALSFWPYRFVTDEDAPQLLTLFQRLIEAGKHLAIMAHYNHWRELSTDIARQAIQRLRATGAQIRSQGPLLAHINDDADTWAKLWNTQVWLGIVPYYLFVERDTGARHRFEVPLARAWDIYQRAIQQVSGLGRTARGPSMSASPGKVEVQGITHVGGEKVFVLRFIQGRNPDWVQRPFFAKFDAQATWLDQLRPAFGEPEFFFEPEYRALCEARG